MTQKEYREEIKRQKKPAGAQKPPVKAFLLIITTAVLASFILFRFEAAQGTESATSPIIRSAVPEKSKRTEKASAITREPAETFECVELEKGEIVTLASAAQAINEAELEMLACIIYAEAGGNDCGDLCRQMVGDVVLNRMEDPRFPDTIEEVLTQEGQYGVWHWTGIQWPERASHPGETEAVERAYDTARYILEGNHSGIYGKGYIWEAEFPQGSDVIVLDGIYFGR